MKIKALLFVLITFCSIVFCEMNPSVEGRWCIYAGTRAYKVDFTLNGVIFVNTESDTWMRAGEWKVHGEVLVLKIHEDTFYVEYTPELRGADYYQGVARLIFRSAVDGMELFSEKAETFSMWRI